MHFYDISVNFPKKKSVFTYKSEVLLRIGTLVHIPLGKRKSTGVVLKEVSEIQDTTFDIKEIIAVFHDSFNLSTSELELYTWMSKYYHYPLGKLVFDSLPKILKKPRKIEFEKGLGADFPFDLTTDQKDIFEKINKISESGFSKHYIHGITGSGKSLIYLKLIKEMIKRGKSAQFLLPEINLTPQFVEFFKEYVDCEVLSYHSGVTASEKNLIWKKLKESKEPLLVMGVRSSVFLPVSNLGLIVVDEEHDTSFKQNDRCPYNGRDVAIKKAQLENACLILGSATPSVENYYLFKNNTKDHFYYSLKERVGEGHLPKLKLFDIRDKFSENDTNYPLLPSTLVEIEKRLDKGEQVLVFINKLGFSNYLQCRNCGYQFKNKACGCDNNLRYFKKRNYLSCAHCDFKMMAPTSCPECGSMSLLTKGFGTEKVEEVLKEKLKKYKTERFDRDEVITLKDLNDKLTRFHNHEIDIFVGTQMLSKGHNFKKVNLVVILGIDQMLNYADFRATERAYQLTSQVMGRAGRFGSDADVIIQTLSPTHKLFHHLKANHFDEFYEEEIKLRELCFCPPFSKIIMVFFSSRFRERLIETISSEGKKLRELLFKELKDVQLYGPTPMSIEKKANEFTWAFMLKSNNPKALYLAAKTFYDNYQDVPSVSVKIDVDSQFIL